MRSGVNGVVKVRFGSIFVSLRFPNKRSVERKQFAIARVRENRSSVKFLCSHRVFLHLSKFKSFTLSLSLFFFLIHPMIGLLEERFNAPRGEICRSFSAEARPSD